MTAHTPQHPNGATDDRSTMAARCAHIAHSGLHAPGDAHRHGAGRVGNWAATVAATVAAAAAAAALGTRQGAVIAATAVIAGTCVHLRAGRAAREHRRRVETENRDTLFELGSYTSTSEHRATALATIAAITGGGQSAVWAAHNADVAELTRPEAAALRSSTGDDPDSTVALLTTVAGPAAANLYSLAVAAAIREADDDLEDVALDMTVTALEQLRAHPHWDERYATGPISALSADAAAGPMAQNRRSFDDIVGELAAITDTVSANGGDPVELADTYTALAATWDGTAIELAHTVADIWAAATSHRA